jgi:hypothetical protein
MQNARVDPMNDIETLRKTIRELHGCESRHLMSVPIREAFDGDTIWAGNVEVFFLIGHPEAREAYAWSYADDHFENHDIAVLGVGQVTTAREAVRVHMRSKAPKSK